MSHPFHYFTPDVKCDELAPGQRFNVDILKRLRLDHLADLTARGVCPGLAFQDVTFGGRFGAMFTPGTGPSFPPVVTMQAGQQTWMPAGSCFIGWETDDPPGPDTQRRREVIAGRGILDDGGREWIVPVARSSSGNSTLPNDLEWDVVSGEPKPVRAKRFDELWTLAGELMDYWNKEHVDGHDSAWAQRMALKALQVNYRISPMELNAFRAMGLTLMDETRGHLIGAVLFDLEIVHQVVDAESKKN